MLDELRALLTEARKKKMTQYREAASMKPQRAIALAVLLIGLSGRSFADDRFDPADCGTVKERDLRTNTICTMLRAQEREEQDRISNLRKRGWVWAPPSPPPEPPAVAPTAGPIPPQSTPVPPGAPDWGDGTTRLQPSDIARFEDIGGQNKKNKERLDKLLDKLGRREPHN